MTLLQSMRRLATLALLLTLSLAAAAAAEPPDTPAGRVFSAWLAALNSGDAATVQAFDARHRREPRPVERTLEFRRQTGGFTLVRIEQSAPRALTALLRERADPDHLARLELAVDDAEPPRLTASRLELVPPPPDLAPARLTQPQALAALVAKADEEAAADRFAGVLLVAQDGQPQLQRAWGVADRATGAPLTLDSRFRIGSMNKMFTAVAVLQLVQAGKLGLDDPLAKHLPAYPNRDFAARVTVRQLLNHSGGAGDIFTDAYWDQRERVRDIADYLALFGARAPTHEPGSRFDYANYGYVLLGALIEAASGQGYEAYLQTHVFGPAGMTATGAAPETEAVPQRVPGYQREGQAWRPNTDTLPWRGTPAGGGYSTAGDLLRFAQALQGGKLLAPALLAQATQAQPPAPDYGWGFGVRGEGALRRYGHNGGAPGMNGDLRIFPELGVVVIALSNLDPPAASRLADFYTARMPASR